MPEISVESAATTYAAQITPTAPSVGKTAAAHGDGKIAQKYVLLQREILTFCKILNRCVVWGWVLVRADMCADLCLLRQRGVSK